MKNTRPTTKQMRRIIFALLVSVALNGTLLVGAFFVEARQESLSRIANIANALLEPAGQLTEYLVPGHSGTQIVMLFVFSLLIYAVLAWVILSLPVWWQHRE